MAEKSFLLITDLTDYRPLQAYLDNDLIMGSTEKRRAISNALSSGLAAIHDAGLAHRDLSHMACLSQALVEWL